MAGRIRTLKPELLEDERVAALSSNAFRLFVGCILLADDYGNLRIAVGMLAGAVFWQLVERGAFTADDVEQARAELLAPTRDGRRPGLLTPYMVNGQVYAHITGWEKHQKVDRPGAPRVPAPSDQSAKRILITSARVENIREAFASDSRERRETHATDPDHRSPITDQYQTNAASAAPEPCGSGSLAVSETDQPKLATWRPADSSPDPEDPDTQSRGDDDPQSYDASAATQPDAPPAADAASTDPAQADRRQAADQQALPIPLPQPEPSKRAAIREVYETYVAGWKATIGGTRQPKLDDKRAKLIAARLREFPIEDLKTACRGVWLSDFHVAGGYHGLELVMRDAAHVERFIATAERALDSEAERVRRFYGAKWAAHTGEPYAASDADLVPAWKLLQNARRVAAEPGAPTVEQCVRHWVARLFADEDPRVTKAFWPLSMLPLRLGTYGLPGAPASNPRKSPCDAPPPAAPPPAVRPAQPPRAPPPVRGTATAHASQPADPKDDAA